MNQITYAFAQEAEEDLLAQAIKKKCRATGIEPCGRGTFVYYGGLRRIGHIIRVVRNYHHVQCIIDFTHPKDGRHCVNLLFNDLDELVEAIPTLVWHITLDKKGGTRAHFRWIGGYYLDRVKEAIENNRKARADHGDKLPNEFYADDCAKVGSTNPMYGDRQTHK